MTMASGGNLNVVTIMRGLETAKHSKMCTVAQLSSQLFNKRILRNLLTILQIMLKNGKV